MVIIIRCFTQFTLEEIIPVNGGHAVHLGASALFVDVFVVVFIF